MSKKIHRRLFQLTALRVLTLFLVGCQPEVGHAPTPEEAPVEQALVEGWSCERLEECFALEKGKSRIFTRQVGERVERQEWKITGEQRRPDGRVVWTQSGGPESYELSEDQLSFTIQGELLPALRFPVVPGERFVVQRPGGRKVWMEVGATGLEVKLGGEKVRPCLEHLARFENKEQPEIGGLEVKTIFCEGIGEVQREIVVPGLPHTIRYERALEELGEDVTLASASGE